MPGIRLRSLAALTVVASALANAPAGTQETPQSLDEIGSLVRDGRSLNFRIRNLPVSSFPELPDEIAHELVSRGCVIPQTYEAKRPENVIHGSFERAGSSDWAVLCSVKGGVSLLVFLAGSAPSSAITLATAAAINRTQPHGPNEELGFDWGIDPATPRQVHDAQATLPHRPPAPDHDCIEEIEIDRRTIYHLYKDGAWQTVPTE